MGLVFDFCFLLFLFFFFLFKFRILRLNFAFFASVFTPLNWEIDSSSAKLAGLQEAYLWTQILYILMDQTSNLMDFLKNKNKKLKHFYNNKIPNQIGFDYTVRQWFYPLWMLMCSLFLIVLWEGVILWQYHKWYLFKCVVREILFHYN